MTILETEEEFTFIDTFRGVYIITEEDKEHARELNKLHGRPFTDMRTRGSNYLFSRAKEVMGIPDGPLDHTGCYSYPNCDLMPNGCHHVMGWDAESYGHR